MRILVFLQREWAFLYSLPLIKRLKEKNPNLNICGWVYKISTWDRLKKYDFFDKLWLGYKFDDQIYDISLKKKFSSISISEIETELKIDSIWKNIINVDRNLIYTPGKKFKYKYQKQVTDEDAINIVKLNYYFIKNTIYKKYKPDVVLLPNFGSIFHNILYHFFKNKNVKFICPISAKLPDRVLISNNPFYDLKDLMSKYKYFKISPKSKIKYANYLKDLQFKVKKNTVHQKIKSPFSNISKNFFLDTVKLPIRLLKIIYKNSNPLNPKVYRTLDNIKSYDFFLNHFEYYLNLYHLNKYQYQTYENDYAYFSLHVEPEISTLVWAPLFTNQIELIRKIALSLPNGLKLLVKEHPYMFGKRNINYYKKIESIPNVRLIDHQIQTEKIINNNKCKAVFVISGTSGFEAMLRGKIVFLFSKMFYDFLENVFYVNNLNDISKILKSNMNHNF